MTPETKRNLWDDNWIEMTWRDRRVFRIGPLGVWILLIGEIVVGISLIALILRW